MCKSGDDLGKSGVEMAVIYSASLGKTLRSSVLSCRPGKGWKV